MAKKKTAEKGRKPVGRRRVKKASKPSGKAPAGKSKPRKKAVCKTKRPPGRPTLFCEKAAVAVLEGIMGGDSLAVVCEPDTMPAKRTWMYWVAADVRLQLRYVAAMQIRALGHVEEIIPLADNCEADKQAIAKARMQIQAREWQIQRLQNKVYGRDGVQDKASDNESLATRLKTALERMNEVENG